MSIGLLVAGSPAVLTDANFGPRRVVVKRVGRKYLYLRDGRTGYDRETGIVNDGWGNAKLWTLDDYDAMCRVETARRELWDFGVRVERSISDVVLLEIREALLKIIPRTSPPSSDSEAKGTTK